MNATITKTLCRGAGALRVRGMVGSEALDAKIGTATIPTTRQFSSYVLDGFGGRGGGGGQNGMLGNWPVTKGNTIFNIVPQGYKFVVERFGKLHSVEESGWFLAIPLVDQIAYVIDVRERAIDIEPQAAITRDNVSVEVSGNLFVKFQDPEKAAYGALNPLYSVMQVNTYNANSNATYKYSFKTIRLSLKVLWRNLDCPKLFFVIITCQCCVHHSPLLTTTNISFPLFAARTIGHAIRHW